MSPWFQPVKVQAEPDPHLPPHPLPLQLRKLSDLRSKSGTLFLFGLGILSWIIAQFVGIISWISASNVRLTKPVLPVRNAQLLGGSAIMHFTFTVLADGSKLVKSVHWIIANGNFRSMVTRNFLHLNRWTKYLSLPLLIE